jgi:hypothetical protein
MGDGATRAEQRRSARGFRGLTAVNHYASGTLDLLSGRRGSARLRAVLLLLLVFGAGALAGVAVTRVARTHVSDAPLRARLTLATPAVLDQLDLTPPQRQAADSILMRRDPRVEAIMREMIPRLNAVAESVDAELSHILTPAQRARLDSLRGRQVLLLKHRDDATGKSRVDTVR